MKRAEQQIALYDSVDEKLQKMFPILPLLQVTIISGMQPASLWIQLLVKGYLLMLLTII